MAANCLMRLPCILPERRGAVGKTLPQAFPVPIRSVPTWISSVCRPDRHRGSDCPLTPATPPCVRVRTRRFEKLRCYSSTSEGRPSDLKWALESPTERALAFARYQGPSPLPAVLLANRGRTPSSISAARRRRGVFHCRHIAALRRNRTQRVSANNTSGVSQKPK